MLKVLLSVAFAVAECAIYDALDDGTCDVQDITTSFLQATTAKNMHAQLTKSRTKDESGKVEQSDKEEQHAGRAAAKVDHANNESASEWPTRCEACDGTCPCSFFGYDCLGLNCPCNFEVNC